MSEDFQGSGKKIMQDAQIYEEIQSLLLVLPISS
jgi:hypothetical protein